MKIALIIFGLFCVLVCYSACVVASDADDRAEQMKEREDDEIH